DCTKRACAEAPGASIVTSPPEPCTTACGNSGLPSSSSARPGISGYMPSAAHTYHDDISPRSSLPGMPSGAFFQIVSSTTRTAFCVCQGWPAKSNSHGVPIEGSLFNSGYNGPALVSAQLPWLSWKNASSREVALARPPKASNKPCASKGTIHRYCAAVPSTKPSSVEGVNAGHEPSALRFWM